MLKTIVKKNSYLDSVTLMSVSTKANLIEGVTALNISMGTDKNKEVLRNSGLLSQEAESAKKSDLIISFKLDNEDLCDSVVEQIEELLNPKKEDGKIFSEEKYYSIDQAVNDNEQVVVISVPGEFAAYQAQKALDLGKHVMMFSDNVSIEDEKRLKEYAHSKGLLLMGPDCGTAIINGKGLCFANSVRRGPIGIVAASGTGAQELSVRIHDFGGGISQLIGVGGRDLSKEIGGIMMLDALDALEADDATEVIALISKQPEESVAAKILNKVKEISKPVVICFIDGNEEAIKASGAYYAKTTKRAALQAVLLMGLKEEDINLHSLNLPLIEEIKGKLNEEQKYIRGFFCGGTICQEVYYLIKEKYPNIKSNITKPPFQLSALEDMDKLSEHLVLDLGADEFTDGRPHPMIDPTSRFDYIVESAKDPKVGVIVLDFVLGYGAHENPVEITLPAIKEAKAIAEKAGRHLEILGFILGTETDPQGFDKAAALLDAAGVTWASSVENTGLLSRGFVEKGV